MSDVFHVQFPGLGIDTEVKRVALNIFGWDIAWYGIIIAMAFVLAILYAARYSKDFALNRDKMLDVALVAVVSGIVGARLYYVIFSGNPDYLSKPWEILFVWKGGLAFYGAVIGGGLGVFFASRWRKINILAMMDLGVIGLLIGQGIGRWGNFINQEAFGSKTALPWGMISERTDGFAVHPCFLYESLWCLLGVVFLHIFIRKWRRYDGQSAIIYALWNGVGRFFIEGLRTDSLMLWGMRISQVLALLLVVGAVVALVLLRKRTKLEGMGYGRSAELVRAEQDKIEAEQKDIEKEAEPIKAEDIDPVETGDVEPAELEDIEPAEPEDIEPAELEGIEPAETGDTEPAELEDIEPVKSEDLEPEEIAEQIDDEQEKEPDGETD